MNTLTIGLSDRRDSNARFLSALKGKKSNNFVRFDSPGLLFKTLTLKRWDILQALTSQEAVSIREAARLVYRDVKAVHGDITALLNADILEKTEDNKIIFPFDNIHVDFVLSDAG